MLRRISIVFVFLLQIINITNVTANNDQSYIPNIEMYGTSEKIAAQLMKKYDKRLKSLAQAMVPNTDNPDGLENSDLAEKMYHSIKNSLVKEDYFSFVDISGIVYPDDHAVYITIDVVDKNDNEKRNSFSKPPSKIIEDKSEIISDWQAYEIKGWELLQQGEINLDMIDCPAYHCLFGFEHEALRSYLSRFNTAEQHEKELVDILTNDADPNKRRAAVSLIAHFTDPKKIVTLLYPALDDDDFGVRNISLRVIGTTAIKAKNQDLPMPINKIIKTIDDPTTIARNKALLVLQVVVEKDNKYHQYVKTNAGQTLVNLLKLKQPNNHDSAYNILKEISGKDYDERDIDSWEK